MHMLNKQFHYNDVHFFTGDCRAELRIISIFQVSQLFPDLDFWHDCDIGTKAESLNLPEGIVKALIQRGPLASQLKSFARQLTIRFRRFNWFEGFPELRAQFLGFLLPARCSVVWDESIGWSVYRTKLYDGEDVVLDMYAACGGGTPLECLVDMLLHHGFESIDLPEGFQSVDVYELRRRAECIPTAA